MASRKDIKDLIKHLEQQGWEVERRGSGHFAFTSPVDGHKVFCPFSPSDSRGIKNVVTKLKRHGFRPPKS